MENSGQSRTCPFEEAKMEWSWERVAGSGTFVHGRARMKGRGRVRVKKRTARSNWIETIWDMELSYPFG